MPRQADPHLRERILDAARKLYLKGGEKALSLRVLAKAAQTNTPAVYRRFRSRKEILRALVQRVQQDLVAVVQACDSPQEACYRTLEFALAHPHEYQLISTGVSWKVNEPRPVFELMKRRSAELLGGAPEDHAGLVLALWALVHGVAMLLISKAVPLAHAAELRLVLAQGVELMARKPPDLSVRK